MSRKRTGLRNRFRAGRSTYSVRRKGRESDLYGDYSNGTCVKPDIIAGHQLNAVLRTTVERQILDSRELRQR